MIADTWLLVSLRWQVAWNSFGSRSLATRVLSALGIVFLVLFAGGISALVGIGSGALLRYYPELRLEALIPGVILTAVALLLLISSFGIALGSLFLTSDLDLLMTAPVDRRAVFISKLLDGMAWTYTIVAVLALPALVAYGIGMRYGPPYYVLALVTLVGMPLLPAALAALLVMLVARFAPARRVREIIGVVAALFGITCGLLGQTSRFWIGNFEPNGSPESTLNTLRGVIDLPLPPMLAGRGLAAAGVGDWASAGGNIGAFLLVTFGFFAFCVWVADSLYAAGWVRMQSSGTSKRNRQRSVRAAQRSGWLGRAPADIAILLKDWRVIPRDLRNFVQLLSPLLFLPIVYLNLITNDDGSSRGGPNGPGFLDRVPDLSGVFLAGGVLVATMMVFGRIAETGISMEGKSWWLLKAAPISGTDLLRGKLLASLIPFALLSTLLLAGAAIWKHFHLGWFLYGWYGVELLGAGMMAISVGLSVPWAKLDWDDPRRMSSGWASVVSLVGWALLGLVAGGLLCLPLLAEAWQPEFTVYALALGLFLSTAVTAATGLLVFRIGVSKLPDVGET